MRRAATALLTLVLLGGTSLASAQLGPVEDSPEGRQVYELLGQYYDEKIEVTFVSPWLEDLSSESPEARAQARRLLLLTLRQSERDERTGRSPEDRLSSRFGEACAPFEVRRHIALESLGGTNPEIARWLLFEEPHWEINHDAYGELVDHPEAEGTSLLEDIVALPHSSHWILSGAFALLLEQNPDALLPHAEPLAWHPRESLRKSAREFLERRSVTLPDEASPSTIAHLHAGLREVLAKATWNPIPPSPIWVDAEPHEFNMWGNLAFTAGWQIGKRPGSVQVATVLGDHRWVPLELVKRQTPLEDDPNVLRVAVDQIVSIRRQYQESEDHDEKRRLARLVGNESWMMPVPWTLSVPEIQLAAWASELKDDESFAALLLPELQVAGDDRSLASTVQFKLGRVREEQMLRAFVDDRDYQRTAEIATHLCSGGFGDAIDRRRAARLASLLERRSSDFEEFRLPTSIEWKQLQKSRSRREQIDDLCQRLRLLNTKQLGNPGGPDPLAPQWSVKLAESEELDPRNTRHPLAVINPLAELRKLDLTRQELLWLLPYLDSEDYFLTYDYYRFGGGQIRELHRVRDLIAMVLHEATEADSVQMPRGVHLWSPGGKKRFIAEVRRRIDFAPQATLSDVYLEIVRKEVNAQKLKAALWTLASIGRGNEALDTLLSREESPAPPFVTLNLIWLLDRRDLTKAVRELPIEQPSDRSLQNAYLALHSAGEEQSKAREQLFRDLEGPEGLWLADQIFDHALEHNDRTLITRMERRLTELTEEDWIFGFYLAQRMFAQPSGIARDFFLQAIREESESRRERVITDRLANWLDQAWLWRETKWTPKERIRLADRVETLHRDLLAGRVRAPSIPPYVRDTSLTPSERPCDWVQMPSWNGGVPHRGIIQLITEVDPDPPR